MPKRLKKPDKVLKAATRRVPILPDDFYEKIPRQMRSMAFTITGIESTSQIKTVLDSLNKVIDEGGTFNQWKNEVDVAKFNKLADYRKEAVFRTHLQTATNQGTYQYALENKDIKPYLRYSAVLDDRTRPNHEALDGVTRPVDDPFWDNRIPPLGINCRCEILPLGKAEADQGGTRQGVNPSKPRGKGLTKPSKIKEISKAGKPDRGWDYNKLAPTKPLTNYFKKRVKTLPEKLAQTFLDYIGLRKLFEDVWWGKNKDLFKRD